MREQRIEKAVFYGDFETAELKDYATDEKVGHDWFIDYVEGTSVARVERLDGYKVYHDISDGGTSPWGRISCKPIRFVWQGETFIDSAGRESWRPTTTWIRRAFVYYGLRKIIGLGSAEDDNPFTIACEYQSGDPHLSNNHSSYLQKKNPAGNNINIAPIDTASWHIVIADYFRIAKNNIARLEVYVNPQKRVVRIFECQEGGGFKGVLIWAAPETKVRHVRAEMVVERGKEPDCFPTKRHVYMTHQNGKGVEVGVMEVNRVM